LVEEISLFPDTPSLGSDDRQTEKRPSPPRKNSIKAWHPPKNFTVHGAHECPAPEHYRSRRKVPYPDMLDEIMFKLVPALPEFFAGRVLCTGSTFPAVVAQASLTASTSLCFCEDEAARKGVRQLNPTVRCLDNEEDAYATEGFSAIIACQDSPTGRQLAEKILFWVRHLGSSGVLILAVPSGHLLDYSTNVRNEAALMRDRIHKNCRTHFILRPTAPLMDPAWDIVVLSHRPSESPVPKNWWRITGTGFLPWQKCNEAVSSAPWLLVESLDQIPAAIARSINYPWEPLPRPVRGEN
jgi:hypothetical protein